MKNVNFKATMVLRSYGSHTYTFEGAQGMTKEEILDACDYANFGGFVSVNENGAGRAVVYVD